MTKRPAAPEPAPTMDLMELGREVGAISAIAREDSELRGAIVAARHFPRDEERVMARILKACENPTFAEDAEYVFKRGKKQADNGQWVDNLVDGLSIEFARETARMWGNMRYGMRVVSVDGDYGHIKGFALDLETNTYAESEDKFRLLIFRRAEGWVKPDERDLRELMNRRGSILVRNAILQVLPAYLKQDAHAIVKATKLTVATSELTRDPAAATAKLLTAFAKMNVKKAEIEAYLGHPIESMTAIEYSSLSGIGKSIRDGNSAVADHFGPKAEEAPGTASVDIEKIVTESATAPSDHPSAAKRAETPLANANFTSPAQPAKRGRLF